MAPSLLSVMLFVGYGAPSSPSQPHHPSTSASVRTIRSQSLSSDAIEADLRSLYSQALRLQNSKQHSAALALYRRILTHHCYHYHRAQHDSGHTHHGRHGRLNGGEEKEEEGVVEGADRGLEQFWRLTWRNVGDLFQSDSQPHLALHCYHTAIASYNAAHPTSSTSSAASLRSLLLSLSRSAVQLGQLSLARRALETALGRTSQEADGSEWDVVDALVDVLYCIGDQHALATLLETAVQRDGDYVKGVLLYSQLYAASPSSLSLSAAVYTHCQRQLQQMPRSNVHTVTKQLLHLATTQRLLSNSASCNPAISEPSAIHRTLTVSSAAPLTSFATSLLSLHKELTQAQKQQRKLSHTANTLTVQRLLRLMKHQSKQADNRCIEQIDKDAMSGPSATTTAGSATSTFSLSTPLILTISSTGTVDPPSIECGDEKRDEKDADVIVVSDNSKGDSTEQFEVKRRAAVQYAQAAVGEDVVVDELTLSFDHPSVLPLPTIAAASHPIHTPPVRPSDYRPSSDDNSLLSTFLSQHASSSSCNSGCVDVMHRYLQGLRETAVVGVDCVVLARLVDVVLRYRLLLSDDVDELLFCGEIVLDALSNGSLTHFSTTSSTLSSLIAQLSLCALSPTSTLSASQRIRFSHLRAHQFIFDNDVSAAVQQLQSTIELLSAHPSSSPIHLLHCPHIGSISPSSLRETVERLQALHLLHELSELSAVSSHAAVIDAFLTAHSVEPVGFEQRLLAMSKVNRQQLTLIVLRAAAAENNIDREWLIRRVEGRLLAAQLVTAANTEESVVEELSRWCERVLSLSATLSSTIPPTREEVLDMLRTLTVSLSLLIEQTGSSVDRLDVPLLTTINRLSTYYHSTAMPVSPSSATSSSFPLHLSLLSSSHHLLGCVNGCRSAAGRALLSSYLDSLFHNRHLRLHEHHSVATLLPLLPPLPTCFMPTTPPPPSPPSVPSMSQPASMVLNVASRLLSDLCDLFSPSFPSHLLDKSHCAAHKDEMLSSPLWRARLLHLLGSHILTSYELTGSVAVVKEMRESILACLEQLADYTPQPTIPSSSFITAYLTHPPSLSLASSFALIPDKPVVWADELTTHFYRFHGHYILPAYIQRVNEADDWYSNASYRREWESEQALLSSRTTLCLLSNPKSPYLWYSLALLHWEPAQRELSSAYAELCIDPLHLTRQQSEQAGKRREDEERVRASGWVEKVNCCTRCFLYCLHLLNAEFGGSDATLRRIFEATDDQLSTTAGNENGVTRPDSMDRRLVLIVWEKLAFLAYRLAQMMQYLPFLRGEEAAVSAIRVIPPDFTRRRTPSPTAVAAAVHGQEEGLATAVDELRVSYACFRVAARLAPRHWVVEYMMGKSASKMDRMPHNYIRHFQTAADLCYEQWKQQKETAMQSAERVEMKEEKDEMDTEADTVTADEMDEAAGASVQDGDNTEDEDAEDEEEQCRMNVYPLYRLHSWRLKLAEHVKRLVTQSGESEADVISVQVGRSTLPTWNEAEREEVLAVLEASSFSPPWIPASSPSPTASSTLETLSADRASSPTEMTSASLSSTDAAIVTRCDSVVSNVALAMHECIRRDSRCYSALTKLAHIWLDRQSTKKLRWLTDRLQPFAHYARSKPLNKFDKVDGRTVDTELHAFSHHPRQLDWWQYTPWRGCAGYFKCLEWYVELLVRLRSITGFLSLYTLVNLARRLPDLPGIKRLHVYGRYLMMLLERLASDGGEGEAAGGGVASEYELLCQRACEVCVQLHDQNIHMQRLLVLAYVVQHQRAGQEMPIDAVDHADVRRWLMEKRWARRINVGDLIGGTVGQATNQQSGAGGGRKRRREDDSSRQSAERMEEDLTVQLPSKKLEADSSALFADGAHTGQPAEADSVSSSAESSNAGTKHAIVEDEATGSSLETRRANNVSAHLEGSPPHIAEPASLPVAPPQAPLPATLSSLIPSGNVAASAAVQVIDLTDSLDDNDLVLLAGEGHKEREEERASDTVVQRVAMSDEMPALEVDVMSAAARKVIHP